MDNQKLRQQVERACRHLLSELDRDPYSPTFGCFDRRYWSWKIVDYPEATFQRNLYPLAWWLQQATTNDSRMVSTLQQSVRSAIEFTTRIQHRDGSFDQAFPNEHSFGATAFLLHPLLLAYQAIQDQCNPELQVAIEDSLRRAGDFLCRHDETHGHIANHLSGAALSLLLSADYFREARYEDRATELLNRVLAKQSPEGWFLEYEGADPGYQTLCLYYLAQVYHQRPEARLHEAIERAVSFLSWFVHPDGTFGGEYGSRRTAIYYPGGLASLSREFPFAWSITQFMLDAIVEGRTISLADVDIGNLAPLLSNYISVLESDLVESGQPAPPLPFELDDVNQDFKEAGLFIRGNYKHYAILGASNGGVLKVFDRDSQTLIWDDGGYVGQLSNGKFITTQMTDHTRAIHTSPGEVRIGGSFFIMLRAVPAPAQFVLLRLLNLTAMRSTRVGNWIKNMMVRRLISGKQKVPFSLSRIVHFDHDKTVITDTLKAERSLSVRWLDYGRPFAGIHMATAQYFDGHPSGATRQTLSPDDIDRLRAKSAVKKQVVI